MTGGMRVEGRVIEGESFFPRHSTLDTCPTTPDPRPSLNGGPVSGECKHRDSSLLNPASGHCRRAAR